MKIQPSPPSHTAPPIEGDWPYDEQEQPRSFLPPTKLPLQKVDSGEICPSCGRHIDANTAECGCSA